jgi:ATP-dependent exoDNAse (exonuclease V) beta subunit
MAGPRGLTGFLAEIESQQIPADPMRESDLRGSAVRVLTAHRAKGLEWELVVVAGVQEGTWPDVRRRGSLLEADRLGRRSVTEAAPVASRIAEERRLFYVACTRARSRLVVTAVAGTEGEGDQPSRFLGELGVAVQTRPGRPRRPLSLAALVGELRQVSVDPEIAPGLREQAANRLARLAQATAPDGHRLAPGADPDRWWGLHPLSAAGRPVVPEEEPVRLSGSQLAGVLACSRRWFLSRQARAEGARSTAASFGSVIHVLTDHGARTGADLAELTDHLDTVWRQLDFDANWLSAVERVEAESALERFVLWQQARTGSVLLGTEVEFSCRVDVGGEQIHLTGSADRVERDPDGRVRIVDFKTGRTPPSAADVALHDQLGVYQLAVAAGALAEIAGPDARPGGAELVYLRLSDGPSNYPKVFTQASIDDMPFPFGPPAPDPVTPPPATWVHQRLADAATLIRTERHEARVGPDCRFCAFRGSCPAQPAGRQVVS